MKRFLLLSCLFFGLSAPAQAHSIWVNAFESHGHGNQHAMISLGWGHALPMDDILSSSDGAIALESFDLVNPGLKKTALRQPEAKPAETIQSTGDFDVIAGDMAVQKIALKKDCAQGVYQVAAVSTPSFFTQYIDKKGKKRLQMKPRDEIKDIDKVLMSVKYQAFAKSYLTVGAWTTPKPLGHGLEIIPRTDLSNVHVGDLVEVDVLFYGQPLTVSAQSMEYITAHSQSFGQSDGFFLFSYLMNGKGQFRVQSAGQWMISVNHKDDVTPDGSLKALVGKADQVYHCSSLTFNVK